MSLQWPVWTDKEWESALAALDVTKFDPGELRIPEGHPDGGQWTTGGPLGIVRRIGRRLSNTALAATSLVTAFDRKRFVDQLLRDNPDAQRIEASDVKPGATDTWDIQTAERDALRHEVAAQVYGEGASHKDSRLDIVIGGPGSGKTSMVAQPLSTAFGSLLPDADAAKALIPEYDGGNGAALVHRESSAIVETMVLPRAFSAGDNLVVQTVGRDYRKLEDVIRQARRVGYRVHVHYVNVPPEVAVNRVIDRYRQTGRAVPIRYTVSDVDSKPRASYERLLHEGDRLGITSISAYDNSGPKLVLARRHIYKRS